MLSDAGLRESLKRWGPQRARSFTWEKCARKALDAFEALHAERKRQTAAAAAVSWGAALGRRPRLAFVSPLPPEPAVTARQSARLLPNLARHYEIVCIVDQPTVSDPWLSAEFAIRDVAWFEARAGRFERIVYQLGSSMAHKHMLGLLERHPGVTLLQDFDLSGLLRGMAGSGYAAGSLTRALYESHGFSGLQRWHHQQQRQPPAAAAGTRGGAAALPCNAAVLRESIGVIVPCPEALEWARACYGDGLSGRLRPAPGLALKAAPPAEAAPEPGPHPEQVAESYRDLIEGFYAGSPQAAEGRLLQALARISALVGPSEADLAAVATALAANRPRFGPRQWLLDVTGLAASEAGSGNRRGSRAMLGALIAEPPSGYRVEPVRAVAHDASSPGNRSLASARSAITVAHRPSSRLHGKWTSPPRPASATAPQSAARWAGLQRLKTSRRRRSAPTREGIRALAVSRRR